MAYGQGVSEEYIDLTDFTAGIQSNWISGGSTGEPGKDGAAQLENTYGCVGLPGGGLGPLPAIAETISDTLQNTLETSGYKPGTVGGYDFNRQVVLSTSILTPVMSAAGAGVGWATGARAVSTDLDTPDMLAVQYEWIYDSTNAGNFKKRTATRLYNRAKSTPATFDVEPNTEITGTFTSTTGFRYSRGAMDVVRSVDSEYAGGPGAWYLGAPHLATCYNNLSGTAATYMQRCWPGILVSATDATGTISAGVGCVAVFAHQGRLVFGLVRYDNTRAGDYPMGPLLGAITNTSDNGFQFMDGGTALGWSGLGTLATLDINPYPFDTDMPSGAGVFASMNANELLIVKDRGGAVVIRGDIETGQTTRMPGVPSTFGAANVPVATPLGLIYGTKHGVWSWTGSDTAQNLSEKLDGWFWKPGTTADYHLPLQPKGKFNFSHPYLFAPNNWVLDTRTGGWFRLPTTTTYAHYEVSASGSVYAIPPYIATGALTVAHRYDVNGTTGQSLWSWQSQPLQKAKGRSLRFREVVVVVQGAAGDVVSVQVTGTAGDTDTCTFTLPSGADQKPVLMRKQCNVDADDATVTITGAAIATTAPTLYRCSLGYQQGASRSWD